MNKKVVFIFPGQGAQYAGMGRDFYENSPEAKAIFDKADELLGFPLTDLIFNGPDEELTQTKNSQLAIYVTSLAILAAVQKKNPSLQPFALAGLSLGEYTALTAAGTISFEEGLKLVQARGRFMQEASLLEKGTMAAVLALGEEETSAALKGLRAWVANLNCPGQVVIAGAEQDIASAAEKLKEAGAKRVIPLTVSGAFHTPLMQPAADKLKELIESTNLSSSAKKVVMNVPGDYVTDTEAMKKALHAQVVSPVRWEKGVRRLLEDEPDLFIEMGPGKTLSGMNRKIGVKMPTISIEKFSDLAEVS